MKFDFIAKTLLLIITAFIIFCGCKTVQQLNKKNKIETSSNKLTSSRITTKIPQKSLPAIQPSTYIPDTLVLIQNLDINIPKEENSDSDLDWLTMLIGAISLLISGLGFYYIIKTFDKDIQNRNLTYLAELDKILIEHPELWTFYDGHNRDLTAMLSIKNSMIEITDCNETFVIENGKDVEIATLNTSSKIFINEILVESPFKIVKNEKIIAKIDGSANIKNINTCDIRIQRLEDKLLNLKLKGLIYYKMNHYEVFIRDKKLKEEWKGITKYSLANSTVFREQLEDILKKRQSEYKGLYLDETYNAFLQTYNEYAETNGRDKIS